MPTPFPTELRNQAERDDPTYVHVEDAPSPPVNAMVSAPDGLLSSNSPRSREEGPDVRTDGDHEARIAQIAAEDPAAQVEVEKPAKAKKAAK